jgi:hypothetical protein
VLDEVLTEIADVADQALDAPEPWTGLCEFAAAFVRLRAESCGISEALGGACGDTLEQSLAGLRDRIRLLVQRSQRAGVMRMDVAWQDVPFLLAAAATGDRTLGMHASTQQWERNLQVILDGLRTTQPGPLPGTPPD